MEAERLQREIDRLQKEYDGLVRKHQGVRPSWVSEELCHIAIRIEARKQELENEAGYSSYGERPECDFSEPNKRR
jgi:hypothetical protein